MQRVMRLLFFAILFIVCGDSLNSPYGAPVILYITTPKFTVQPRGEFELTVDAIGIEQNALVYTWTSSGGVFSSTTGIPVVWTAPDSPGEYSVTCTVTEGGASASETIIIPVSTIRKYLWAPDAVIVEGGEFDMGSDDETAGEDERPVHTVHIDAFYIGVFEVTNAEFNDFVEDGGYENELYWFAGGFDERSLPEFWDNPDFNGSDFPVVGINWYEASAFCRWLTDNTDDTYRLPTEAEWEKAAAGPMSQLYPWGWTSGISSRMANYINSGEPYDNGPTPVGFFDGFLKGDFETHSNASPYGAYDMSGNAWEWCSDWYGADYYSQSPGQNPQGPSEGEFRVMRGGSWGSPPEFLRCAKRERQPPMQRLNRIGFRCVREIR